MKVAKFELAGFQERKIHGFGLFSYGKIPTKKEAIRTFGFTSRLPCRIIIVVYLHDFQTLPLIGLFILDFWLQNILKSLIIFLIVSTVVKHFSPNSPFSRILIVKYNSTLDKTVLDRRFTTKNKTSKAIQIILRLS